MIGRSDQGFLFSFIVLSILPQVGESLPTVEVQEGEPKNKVSMDQLFKGKKGVLFAVPGAFTPGCSKVRYLPLACALIVVPWLTRLFFLCFLDSPSRVCAAS